MALLRGDGILAAVRTRCLLALLSGLTADMDAGDVVEAALDADPALQDLAGHRALDAPRPGGS
jgi:hypothetical protein